MPLFWDDSTATSGPVRAALLSARRWAMVTMAGIGLLGQLLVAAPLWGRLTAGAQLGLIVVSVLYVLAFALSARFLGLILIALATLAGVALNFVDGGGSRWLVLNSVGLFAGFCLALLVRRPLLYLLLLLGGLLLWAASRIHPEQLLATGSVTWDGAIPSLQAIAVGVFTSLIWARSWSESSAEDARFRLQESRVQESLADTERGRVWRDAAIAIHESLLNDIRYILNSRGIAADALPARGVPELAGAGTPAAVSVGEVLDQVRRQAGARPELVVESSVDAVELSGPSAACLRAAVLEVVRNAAHHEGSGSLRLRVDADDRVVRVQVLGVTRAPWDDRRASIGTRKVIDESLAAAGGGVELQPERRAIALWVPRAWDAEVGLTDVLTDGSALDSVTRPGGAVYFVRSRIVISCFLAGAAGSGALYFVALMLGPSGRSATMGLLCAAGVVGALIAASVPWRGRRLPARWAAAAIVLPMVVPWLAVLLPADCGAVANLASAINVAGLSILVIGAWANIPVVLIGMGGWLAGSLLLHAGAPDQCAQQLLYPLAWPLLAVPIMFGLVLLMARRQAELELDALRRDRRAAVVGAGARATADLNAELSDLIAECSQVIGGVASTGATAEQRRELMLLESRIRCAVQVDPRESGGFGMWAKRIVEEAVDAGVVVDVRNLSDSGDKRPVGPAAQAFVADLLATRVVEMFRLAAFTAGDADILTIGLPVSGAVDGGAMEFADVEVDVGASAEFGGRPALALVVTRVARAQSPAV